MKMYKKAFALLLTLALAVCLGATALAVELDPGASDSFSQAISDIYGMDGVVTVTGDTDILASKSTDVTAPSGWYGSYSQDSGAAMWATGGDSTGNVTVSYSATLKDDAAPGKSVTFNLNYETTDAEGTPSGDYKDISWTVTVKAPPAAELDYTALEAQIDRTKDLVEDEYTPESWAAMKTELDKAKAMDDAKNAETQDEIDAQTKALKDAIDALVKKQAPAELDYTALEAQISRAMNLNEDEYTPESWAAMKKVLDKAEALDTARNAKDQAEINKLTKELKDAIDALVKKAAPVETQEPKPTAAPAKKDNKTAPKTGDNLLVLGLCVLAVCGGAAVTVANRKKHGTDK